MYTTNLFSSVVTTTLYNPVMTKPWATLAQQRKNKANFGVAKYCRVVNRIL